ncbi:MAG TPA: PHP domain-containing protein [Anaeromyxobacteraceae bacterium]|nr:PHP domain-containing protein [Anaeromyxobacteraceae bacterium]
MKRIVLYSLGLLAAAWVVYGGAVRTGRADRISLPAGEIRGAWHVHTTRSDGRGTVDEVARAAREAGLQFVVVTDHNVLTPADGGYREGVLVVQATEVSTELGHVVALGVPRALTEEERRGDPLRAIAALGGEAVVAHPFHPRRAFTGWEAGAWRGLEVVSNDHAWHRALADRAVGTIAVGLLRLPWDPPQAVLTLVGEPRRELDRLDEALRGAPARGGRPARVLLCSADAHGLPSYDAAFEAFSMHLPLALSGDAAKDGPAVIRALLDGRATCVFDGVAHASGVRLERSGPGRVALSLDAAFGTDLELFARRVVHGSQGARVILSRNGATAGEVRPALADGRNVVDLAGPCGAAGCGPGLYRAEVLLGGRTWILTNPVNLD